MEYLGWLYLATRLDAIHGLFKGMMPLGAMVFFIIFFVSMIFGEGRLSKDSIWYATRWWRRAAVAIFCLGAVGQALIPSKNDAMFIAGGVGVIEASKAIAGSEIAKKSVQIVENWLQDQLDAQPASKNKKPSKAEKAEAKATDSKVKEVVGAVVDGAVKGALEGAKK